MQKITEDDRRQATLAASDG